MAVETIQVLDFKGLACPLPIVKTARAIKELTPGTLVEVFATDRRSVLDLQAWTKATGNELVERTVHGPVRFLIRKR